MYNNRLDAEIDMFSLASITAQKGKIFTKYGIYALQAQINILSSQLAETGLTGSNAKTKVRNTASLKPRQPARQTVLLTIVDRESAIFSQGQALLTSSLTSYIFPPSRHRVVFKRSRFPLVRQSLPFIV